jgi:hypothetical protein
VVGLNYLLVRYGNFFQLVLPMAWVTYQFVWSHHRNLWRLLNKSFRSWHLGMAPNNSFKPDPLGGLA